jgi:prepilin signal peptidase PulO-like enzyme (type II secretory pathway)
LESMPESKGKSRELLEEFRAVLGRVGLLDTILPPVLFLAMNSFLGFQAAVFGALVLAIVIAVFRISRKQSLLYSLAGIGSVGLAIALALFLGRSIGYFLPGIVNGGLTIALALVSLIIRRPMVAWTSFIARRWPLDWYWHPRVRPAYSEVTIAWTFFFAFRLVWQMKLFQGQNVGQLAFVNAILGWPALIILLALSYLYGTWRLGNLKGPSVEEFHNQTPPPWEGQKRGF